MREFTAVLWDLDGVLVDSGPAVAELWRGVAAGYGRVLTPAAIRRDVLGCSAEHTVAALFGDLPDSERRAILRAVHRAEPDLAFVALPGAAALVRRLHAAAVPMALVTGATAARARRALTGLDLTEALPVVVSWEDPVAGKPAPDGYVLAARRLGVPAADCLVVEDSIGGVRAGVAAGCRTVGVGTGGALLRAGAAWVVPTIADLRCTPVPYGLELGTTTGAVRLRPPVPEVSR